MKTFFIYIIIFLMFGTTVFAQEDDLTDSLQIPQKRQEIKDKFEQHTLGLESKIQQKAIEIKEKFERGTTERKINLETGVQERILKATSHIFEKSEATLVKLEGIASRIDSRIVKMKEKNLDVTSSEELLVQAELKIEEATILLAATKIELHNSIQTQTTKEEIQEAIADCKTSIKNAHAALFDVVVSLKNIDNPNTQLLTE